MDRGVYHNGDIPSLLRHRHFFPLVFRSLPISPPSKMQMIRTPSDPLDNTHHILLVSSRYPITQEHSPTPFFNIRPQDIVLGMPTLIIIFKNGSKTLAPAEKVRIKGRDSNLGRYFSVIS